MKLLTQLRARALWPSRSDLAPGALAERPAISPVHLHLLFGLLTGLALGFQGYYYGTFDQIIHIPYLKKYVDPALYPGDPFFAPSAQQSSFFWYLLAPFYRQGILEVAMFVMHLVVTYLTFWAIWTLSETLFHDPLVSLMASVSLAFPHVGFAGFPLLEFSLLNRTFVLPFLLCAIVLYLRGRYALAYGLAGLMCNLHLTSVSFVLAMFLFDSLLRFRRIGLRTLAVGMAAFGLCALPVVLWKAGGSPTDLSVRPEWFATLALGAFSHFFYFWMPNLQVPLTALSGFGTLALFAIGRWPFAKTEQGQVITHFMGAVLIILALEFFTAYWLPITIVIQLQIIRAGVFALLFGYLYFASYLVGRFRSGALGRFDASMLALGMCLSPLAFILVIMWGAQRLVASPRWRQIIVPVGLVALLVGSVALAQRLGLWRPGIHVFPQRTDWYDVQLWARNHTPKDALFITPPHIYGFFETGWRVFSERSTLALFSDLTDKVAYSPSYLETWRPRFEDLAPGALAQFRGDFFENQALTARAFYNQSSADLLEVAHKYGADYLVMEKPNFRDFPAVYENGRFVVYAVPDLR